MIEARGLGKTLAGRAVLSEIDLSVEPGQILILLGPNGAGKTTLIRVLAGILPPSRGTVRVLELDPRTRRREVLARVGMATQTPGFYPDMLAPDYLTFSARLYGLPPTEARQRALELLERFQLSEVGDRPIAALSLGMRQRLALCRALVHDPEVLFLDEPTTALDPENALRVREAIRELRQARRAIVVCTHDLDEAAQLGDRLAILKAGRLLRQGTLEQLARAWGLPSEFSLRLPGGGPEAAELLRPRLEILHVSAQELHYRTTEPQADNPWLVRRLVAASIPILSLQAVLSPLEAAYLEAVRT